MPTFLTCLAIAACLTTVASAMSKLPVWVPLGILSIYALAQSLPR